VIDEPPWLFDVGATRVLTAPTIGTPHHDRTLVVLGSTQPASDLDPEAVARVGASLRRRRGGGGAVLLEPDDGWIELWLPAPAADGDLRATAERVGGWWEDALRPFGLRTARHRGAVQDADQGAVACFAGLGPGEVTVDGRKLVGLSQWRAREGALVSSVLARRSPDRLATLLGTTVAVPRLAEATCLDDLLAGVTTDAVVASFTTVVRGALPSLVQSADVFD
jgi:lipoate-protein ligase A